MMKTRNIVTWTIALIGAAITVYMFGVSVFGIASGINVAAIISLAGYSIGRRLDNKEDKRQGYVVKDERTTRIEEKASRIGFISGTYIWLGLLWYEFLSDNWLPIDPIGSPAVILIGLMLQLVAFFAAMYHYGKQV